MNVRSLSSAAALTALCVTLAQTPPSFAQTPSAPAQTPSTTAQTPAPANSAATGMRMADKATVAIRFITVKPADIMSSKLVGTNLYNNQNESVGEIEDLVIENGKTITGLVVSVGGFLGMGESYVAIDPASVVLTQKDGTWRAIVDTNKDSLKSAPKFTYSKQKR